MKSLTCSHLPARAHRDRRCGARQLNRGNRFLRLVPVRGFPGLSRLVLAAALPLFSGLATQAKEPVQPAPGAMAGQDTVAVEAQTAQPALTEATSGSSALAPYPAQATSDRVQSIVSWAGSGRNPARGLVVFSSTPDAKEQANLQEDLAVMSHILDKALDDTTGAEPRGAKAMGVDLFFWSDAGSLRHGYLEGYGALFLVKVDFPLVRPVAAAEAQKERDEPPGSSAWEEAREEVFGTPGQRGMGPATPETPYSEEKVNRLKATLLEALKNAANIRDLKPDEGVTVCVLGATRPPVGRWRTLRMAPEAKPGAMALLGGPGEGMSQRGTILTIRAKKSDIDAFAKGKLDLEAFRRKASIVAYEGDAGSGSGFGRSVGVGFGGGYGRSSR